MINVIKTRKTNTCNYCGQTIIKGSFVVPGSGMFRPEHIKCHVQNDNSYPSRYNREDLMFVREHMEDGFTTKIAARKADKSNKSIRLQHESMMYEPYWGATRNKYYINE